jgi:hypothetical protein
MAIMSTRRFCGAAGAVLLATTLAACAGSPADPAAMSSQPPDSPPPIEPPPTPMPKPNPVTFKSNVTNSASNIKVDTVVTVKADWGTLTKVKLSYANTDGQGRKQQDIVSGKISKDRTRWTANNRLEPGAVYKLITTGKNWVNQPKTTSTTFNTQKLTLNQQTYPQLYPLRAVMWESVCQWS